MTGNARNCGRLLAAALLLLAGMRPAIAGGGPENVLLIVNSNSWASLTVANEYIALRKIPPVNVFYVDWQGGFEGTDADAFRSKIFAPAISAMGTRAIYDHIDYAVYSSDFPYAISTVKDYPDTVKLPEYASPTASLSSATFLWHLTFSMQAKIYELGINQYARDFVNLQQKIERQTDPPTHGFRSWYGWGDKGELREGGGQPYMLSTMLAMTSGRGNSVGEALDYLKRSASADGTAPKGTIYFTRTEDVRSTSRQDEVAAARTELGKLGVNSRVVSTAMPMQAGDVAGLISGVDNFSWRATGSTILPGAICDNFTSFGGILQEAASQTPLTEFLRYGAAGAAGTVVEPYALAQKFASPNIFVHYARGCSLAESYYQSLPAPAQVLIVGDPLCQPWANIPQVRIGGVQAGDKVSGTVTLKPEARFPKEAQVARFILFVDGRRCGSSVPGEDLVWNSATECDGHHELRVVAIAAGPIETQGRAIVPVTVDNQGKTAILATRPERNVRWGDVLQVAAKAPGAKQIHVLNNGRALGTIQGAEGQLKVDPRTLGLGPVSLHAIALFGDGALERVLPLPVQLTVLPTVALPGQAKPAGLLPGLTLQLENKRVVPVQDTRDPAWLGANGVSANQPFSFQGVFSVAKEEVQQFQLWHYGDLQLDIDGQPLYRGRDGKFEQRFVPINLGRGWHRLSVSGKTGGEPKLRILYGGPGAMSLNGKEFQHTSSR
jgi:hypothetical protein